VEFKRISLRLPEALHERAKRLAEHNRRSLHAELLWLIERGLEQDEDS
jgi:predicted DNA-binding protein